MWYRFKVIMCLASILLVTYSYLAQSRTEVSPISGKTIEELVAEAHSLGATKAELEIVCRASAACQDAVRRLKDGQSKPKPDPVAGAGVPR